MTRTDKERMPRPAHSRADFVCDWGGGQLAVRIRGEIDHHTAVEVRQGIDALLFERRPHRLLLDLSAVSFMDSSGLGLIMGRLSVMRELGGELVVWNPSREVLRIVTLAGMERLVRIEYPPDRAPDIPDCTPERAPNAPGRGTGRAPDRGAERGAGAPETRRNRENHRERHRAPTVQNRGSTVGQKAADRANTAPKPHSERAESHTAPPRRSASAGYDRTAAQPAYGSTERKEKDT